jgi:type I restriction enzyme R subunit
MLIKQPSIELFQSLEYTHQNCFHKTFGEYGALGRVASADVVLIQKLKDALIKLNPYLPDEAINLAIEEPTCDRGVFKFNLYPVIYAKEAKTTAEKTP